MSSASRAEEEKDQKIWLRPVALFDQHLYEGALAEPRGVFFDRAANEVWVADTKNGRIGVFTPDGVPLFSFGQTDHLREPVRLAVAKNGDVYVLGIERAKIERFSYRGEYLGPLQLPGLPEKPVFGTLTVDADGNVWVGENETGQVLGFSAGPQADPAARIERRRRRPVPGHRRHRGEQGRRRRDGPPGARRAGLRPPRQLVKGWGKHDMGAANFSLPEGVAIDKDNRVIVVDALRHEIKLFDLEGEMLDRFGGIGAKAGNVSFPSDVAVDATGRVYVAERGNSRIQVFTETTEPPIGVQRKTKADGKEPRSQERTTVSPESPNDSKR